MFKSILRPAQILRLTSLRPLSKQSEISVPESESKSELVKQNQDQKFDINSLPKNASDNFLIEFQKRKPTYDQLFEYTTEEKAYEKSKPVSKSYLSPDAKIFLHTKYELSFDAFKQVLKRKVYKTEKYSQQYLNRRHGILGKYYFEVLIDFK